MCFSIKPPTYEKFIEEKQCIHTNGMLIKDSCIYTKLFKLM